MRILLSIKPEYAQKIFNGEKRYEFRRTIYKRKGIQTVVVYVSHPIKKIVGEFYVEEVISDTLNKLWDGTKEHAGISEEVYLQYFAGRNIGFALKIRKAIKYKKAFCIKEHWGIMPPQSFIYLD
jgi:predicted transcriptional regulator